MEENMNVIEETMENNTEVAVENNAGSGFKTLLGIGVIAVAGVAAYKGIKKVVGIVKTKLAKKQPTEVVEVVPETDVIVEDVE